MVRFTYDKERPPVSSFLRGTVKGRMVGPLYSGIRSVAAANGLSEHAVVLSAFAALLSRYTLQEEIEIITNVPSAATRGNWSLEPVVTRFADGVDGRELMKSVDRQLGGDRGIPSSLRSNCAFLMLRANSDQDGRDLADALGQALSSELIACELVFSVRESDGSCSIECEYDAELFEAETVEEMSRHFLVLLEGLVAAPSSVLLALPLMSREEREKLVHVWNNTELKYDHSDRVHEMFERQVERSPGATAVVFGEKSITFRELNIRANRLAHYLISLGVGPETPVGICIDRSIEMMVGLLAILKSGGAYVPLDPLYPKERLTFMVTDSHLQAVLTQNRLIDRLPETDVTMICLDSSDGQIESQPDSNPHFPKGTDSAAYIIYTSGSTGKPKGVIVTHRNVANFFAAMDQRLGTQPGAWLAVTSISFDISVLELFWTLSKGYKVVLHEGFRVNGEEQHARNGRKIEFSLLYFGTNGIKGIGERYRLLIDGAKFADRNDFFAVWTPERHFHEFGGHFPNPSVTGAAVAAVTNRVRVMAGSVVLPLQNPIRVAEEWSVIDNISGGRAGVAFASGWQVNDFVLAPENYELRKDVMIRGIETIRKLWKGDEVKFKGADGKEVPVRVMPRPVQHELPVWITATGNPDTFRLAGQLGANVLTHLVGQKLEDLGEKIRLYRETWMKAGHKGKGQVTLMLHTFVGENVDQVREIVRKPFCDYLRSSLDLVRNCPWGFAPARLSASARLQRRSQDGVELDTEDIASLVEYAFEGYFENSSLFGTPESCLDMVDKVKGIDVDEIACLIDFGVEPDAVLESLVHLNRVRVMANEHVTQENVHTDLAATIARHGVTHMQCTPSLASILISGPENERALSSLRTLLVGGEALTAELAQRLRRTVSGKVLNMYGPTETTVWSSVYEVNGDGKGIVPIGRPIGNTEIYIVDESRELVPIGRPGELYIGGAGVARGYLNRPDLTAERFVANPFRNGSGGVLYRTGDLARYRRDGNIEFLGRIDHQIKIRGHRVELQEIEAVLRQDSTVREAVIVARQDTPGDVRLVAYIVSGEGTGQNARELRSHLMAHLPEFMVPSAFVFLERLPLTPNGKIDRNSLPAPNELDASTDKKDPSIAPRDTLELRLTTIWENILGVSPIGVRDNFFELGGHSLLAARLFNDIQKALGRELPFATLFEEPTIEHLSAVLRDQGWTPPWGCLVPIRPEGTRLPMFFIHRNGGNVLIYSALESHMRKDRPIYGFQAKGLDGKEEPLSSVEGMATLYIREMRSIQPKGPYFVGGSSFGGTVAFEMGCQLAAAGEEVGLVALFDTINIAVKSDSLIRRAGSAAEFILSRAKIHARTFGRLPLKEKPEYLFSLFRTMRELITQNGPTHEEKSLSKADQLLPKPIQRVILAADEATRKYVPKRYTGRIALFRGLTSRSIKQAGPALGWKKVAKGGLDIYDVPGDHLSHLDEPNVRVLAEKLDECLSRLP